MLLFKGDLRLLVLLLVLHTSCGSDDDPGLVTQPFSFEDGFEVSGTDIADLLPSDGSRWTNIQQVDPQGTSNEMDIVSSPTSEGNNALRILARASNSVLSKIDIEKGGFQAFTGSKVTIRADFYITTSATLSDLLLIDLECCSCWDPNVPDNQCPGIRLQMSNNNDYLSIERGKISQTTLAQADYSFPRNQWVNVVWEMTLSPDNDGLNTLTIDGNEVISTTAMNMPNADVFRNLFGQNNIDFELQQPIFYERVQIGATANPSAGDIEMFVDNFSITVE